MGKKIRTYGKCGTCGEKKPTKKALEQMVDDMSEDEEKAAKKGIKEWRKQAKAEGKTTKLCPECGIEKVVEDLNNTWEGVTNILNNSINDLIRSEEEGYQFYSAPEGYKLILSGVAIVPSTWKREIKDIGWPLDGKGRKDRFFYRGFKEGDGQIVTDCEKPILELVKRSE